MLARADAITLDDWLSELSRSVIESRSAASAFRVELPDSRESPELAVDDVEWARVKWIDAVVLKMELMLIGGPPASGGSAWERGRVRGEWASPRRRGFFSSSRPLAVR